MQPYSALPLFLLAACGQPTSDTGSAPNDQADLQQQIAGLEATLAELQAQCQVDIADLQEEVAAINGGIDLTELDQAIAQNETAIAELDQDRVSWKKAPPSRK